MHDLDALRARIDSIDQELHDLLIERSQVARRIASAKGPGEAFLRPGREARILRRLVARHEGPLSEAVLIRIWREILAGNTAIQGPLSVAVGADRDLTALRDMTRDHYGAQTPVVAYDTAQAAIDVVAGDGATVAVVPWPQPDDEPPWWPSVAQANKVGPRLVARLPMLASAPEPVAAVVASVPFEDTGADRSLVVIDAAEKQQRLTACLGAAGLTLSAELDCRPSDAGFTRLLELEGYVPAGDTRLADLENQADAIKSVQSLGGYAIPIAVS